MRAICYKCGYVWNYGGKQRGKSYISCPKCSYKLRVDKVLVEDLHSIQEKLYGLDDFKPKIHNKIHTYIHNFERVYFPNGFDCLVHKDIAAQFKELTLEDLRDEEEDKTPMPDVVVLEIKEDISNLCEDHNLPASYDSFEKKWLCNKCRDINILKIIKFKVLGEDAIIREVRQDQVIRTIPRDPIKLLEHQRSFL